MTIGFFFAKLCDIIDKLCVRLNLFCLSFGFRRFKCGNFWFWLFDEMMLCCGFSRWNSISALIVDSHDETWCRCDFCVLIILTMTVWNVTLLRNSILKLIYFGDWCTFGVKFFSSECFCWFFDDNFIDVVYDFRMTFQFFFGDFRCFWMNFDVFFFRFYLFALGFRASMSLALYLFLILFLYDECTL